MQTPNQPYSWANLAYTECMGHVWLKIVTRSSVPTDQGRSSVPWDQKPRPPTEVSPSVDPFSKILDSRLGLGYSVFEATWEPISNLTNCSEVLSAYRQRRGLRWTQGGCGVSLVHDKPDHLAVHALCCPLEGSLWTELHVCWVPVLLGIGIHAAVRCCVCMYTLQCSSRLKLALLGFVCCSGMSSLPPKAL